MGKLSKRQQEVIDCLKAGWRMHSIAMEYGAYLTGPQGHAIKVFNSTLSALHSHGYIEFDKKEGVVIHWKLAPARRKPKPT